MLTSSIRQALLADSQFKKDCLFTIAKQFDINQVSTNMIAWSKLIKLQQAFNVRIQDSGTEDGNLDDNMLPKQTFGLPIPQELTDAELACMKNAVISFMAPRFTVSDVMS